MATPEATNKAALVLSGGGAYGAYEVGVIKALYAGKSLATKKQQLDAAVFTGTSVGNFNAAVMAMNKDGGQASIARLEKIWTEDIADNGEGNGVYRVRGNPYDYLNPFLPGSPMEQFRRMFSDADYIGRESAPRLRHFLSGSGQIMDRALELVDVSALLNVDAFQRLVERCVEPKAIRESGKALRVAATNWNSGDMEEFNFKKMTDEETWAAIRASAAIPGLFPPVKLWGQIFIDGGVVMNTPISPAVEEGATELHVVSLDPDVPALPEAHIANTLDTFDRVYTAMLASKISEDIESARWVNQGLEILEKAEGEEELTTGDAQRFMRVASVLYQKLRAGKLFQKLTIHRYYPKKSLGGLLGMLNFHRDSIDAMIQQGFADTCEHSCENNRCVIPAVAGESEAGAGAVASAGA